MLKKNYRDRGKISIRQALQEFQKGDRVTLVAEPAVQKGMYHRRFHGAIGTVEAKRGECYEVSVKSGSDSKKFVVHPIHLKKVQA